MHAYTIGMDRVHTEFCLLQRTTQYIIRISAVSTCSDTVMTIMSYDHGFEAMWCSQDNETPMRKLIEYLPGKVSLIQY